MTINLVAALRYVADQALPTTWLGVLGLIIVTVPSIIAGLSLWQTRRNRDNLGEVSDKVDDANKQLKNGHTTNLRDDLTEGLRLLGIIKADVERMHDTDIRIMREDLSGFGKDLRALRDDLNDERQARQNLERRVDSYHPDPEP